MHPFTYCGEGCDQGTKRMFSAQLQTLNVAAATRALRQARNNGATEHTCLPHFGMTVGQLSLLLNLPK